MAWRNSAVWLSSGMAMSAGLVWLGRALRRRSIAPQSSQFETHAEAPREGADEEAKSERRARLEAKLDEIVREEANRFDRARDDALHDMKEPDANEPTDDDALREFIDVDLDELEREESDIVFDTQRDPEDVDRSALETARSNDRYGVPDEPYDALDAEDVGSEWLTRATQTSSSEGRDPIDLLEGTNIDDAAVEVIPDSERGYGSDQEGEPLAPHAGTRPEDVAARLPVGTVDAQGNVQLRAPVLPRDALNAPPTGELSPTDRELLRRALEAPPKRSR